MTVCVPFMLVAAVAVYGGAAALVALIVWVDELGRRALVRHSRRRRVLGLGPTD